MTTAIDQKGRATEAGITVRAPALRGTIDASRPGARGSRAAAAVTPLDAVLFQHDLTPTHVALIDAAPRAVKRSGARGPAAAETADIEVEVPDPGPDHGQVILVHDTETGALTWSFAEPASNERRSARRAGRPMRVYRISATPAPVRATGRRGATSMVVKKVIKVFAFKLGGAVGAYFTGRWEKKHRPYAIHALTGNDIGSGLRKAGDDDWRRLRDGRGLLLLHGTFSSTQNGFGRLAPETIATLRPHYPGGVLAFDHFTLTADPYDNIRWFLKQVPREVSLDVDLVTHSRGGLVGRVLAERPKAADVDLSRVTVRRAVLVASPNNGTPLASTDQMRAFVDTYTNLFTYLPDNPVTDGISAVIEAVKDLAAATVDALPGLQAMRPDGAFLDGLNQGGGPETTYYAVAADYEPADPGLAAWAVDRVADAAFRDSSNDLVVPTDGALVTNGATLPASRRQRIKTAQAVHHCNYFGHRSVNERLKTWLGTAR